jgi:hypothetical protein
LKPPFPATTERRTTAVALLLDFGEGQTDLRRRFAISLTPRVRMSRAMSRENDKNQMRRRLPGAEKLTN